MSEKLVYVYQIWPSNNRFYFGGRLMTGPKRDNGKIICTWGAIILIGAPFNFYISPILTQYLMIIPCISYAFYAAMVFFLCFTQFADPGIIPRKEIIEKYLKNSNPDLKKHIPDIEPEIRFTFQPDINICSTCEIIKPARSHHCGDCGNCVQMFDHHCPYVNNCIGQNNYAFFISFLFTCVITAALFIVEFILFVVLSLSADSSTKNTAMIIVSVICGGGVMLIACLLLFHVYLLISGKTTKEQLKHSKLEFNWTQRWRRIDPLFSPTEVIAISEIESIKHDQYSSSVRTQRNQLVPQSDIQQ